MEYTVFISKNPDKSYRAISPLFPGIEAKGQTFDECLANIKDALELCIKDRIKRDQEIPDESDVLKMTIVV
jgi:predicted RNase H-like HicB family nuclease